jgi:hypothetical protein
VAGGIVDSLTGAIGWATSPVYDAVKRLVDGVVGWITEWVNHVIDWASRLFDDLWGFVHQVNDWAHEAAGWIGDEWRRVSGWIGAAVDHATSWVAGRISDVVDWARGEINRAFDFARSIVNDANREAVDGVGRWVSNTILPWVTGELGRLGDWAHGAIDWVVGRAEDLVRGLADRLAPVWDLIQACWGWLEWVARHPYDWFIALWHELADSHPRTVEAMVARGFGAGATHVEDAVLRWFD